MPPVLCERCRTFGRHLGKRCINCSFQLVLLVGAMVGGVASAAHAQKISQFQNEPGATASLSDAVLTESLSCPLQGGAPGNCRTTIQQILNTPGSTQYISSTSNPVFNTVDVGGSGATSNVALLSLTGQQIFVAQGVSGADSYFEVLPGQAATSSAQLVVVGTPNINNILIGGPVGGGALATTATAPFPQFPFTNGVPTNDPVNSGSGATFEINASSQTLNVFVPGFGWHHVALASGAN